MANEDESLLMHTIVTRLEALEVKFDKILEKNSKNSGFIAGAGVGISATATIIIALITAILSFITDNVFRH